MDSTKFVALEISALCLLAGVIHEGDVIHLVWMEEDVPGRQSFDAGVNEHRRRGKPFCRRSVLPTARGEPKVGAPGRKC